MKKNTKIPNYLPVDPILPWMRIRVERDTIEVFSQRVGVSDRRIREALNGRTKRMSFENIDKMITNEGGCSLIEFYPEYDDDERFFALNDVEGKGAVPKNVCSIDDCNDPVHGKGYCNRHYRMSRKGTLAP